MLYREKGKNASKENENIKYPMNDLRIDHKLDCKINVFLILTRH